MEFVPWTTFARIIERHKGDAGVRTLGCADLFRIMAFSQLTWREWAPVEFERQDYAVAVSLEAIEDKLYNSVSLRLQLRTRVRGRARV